MPGKSRASVSVFFCLAASLFAHVPCAIGADALETGKLPRVSGGKEVFASAATTIYTAPDSVSATTEALVRTLTAEGWQSYVPPFTDMTGNANLGLRYFKKSPQALNVSISLAPAQGSATTVSYFAVVLANDLPFPKDATNIAFAPNRPYLSCLTPGTIDATKEFFTAELAHQGYAPDAAATGNGKFKTDVSDNAYYISAGHNPLTLVLQRTDDGWTKVVLDGLVATPGMAETTTKKLKEDSEAAEKSKAPKTASAKSAPEKDSIEQLAADMIKRAEKIANDAMAEAKAGGKAPSKAKPDGAGEDEPPAVVSVPLEVLAENKAPIPVPATARGVYYKGADGTLSFTALSTVKAMAAFYRSTMKPKGWTEKKLVINQANMVMLEFQNGDKDLSVTIMQHGENVGVSANGSALEVADANAPPPTPEAEKDLEAEEKSGLPIPTAHTFSVGGSGAFRKEISASVTASLDAVLAFYRRELSKRDWKEDAGADVKTEQALVAFKAPDGPARLKLERKNNETVVTLFVRNQVEATKSGLLPKSGQAKILLGNVTDKEAEITINRQSIKVQAGAGTKAPDGPSLEIPPGKYKYSTKSGGKPAKTNEIEVGADDIWGLMIAPGGGLPLQMY